MRLVMALSKRQNAQKRLWKNHLRINHGYGYKTLYAHLDKYIVKRKTKSKTGRCNRVCWEFRYLNGSHLHYEVIRNDKKVNPVNYYFNDLTAEEYDKMLELASQENQSFGLI